MARMRGADVVAEMLVRLGVPYIAGVPGHTVLDLVDALYERRDRIGSIITRNEETASYLADAYFRLAGRPMAVMAHNSVGAANLLTGVMNARLDSSTMIVISGDVWTKAQGRGGFQELVFDRDAGTPDIFRGSVKRSWQVNKAEKLPETFLKAYKEAVTGRPGPVHIDITQEAFAEVVDVDLPPDPGAYLPVWRSRGASDATATAAELLRAARRPAVLAGGGALRSGAGPEILAVAEALRAPLGTTVSGKGVIAEDHDLAVGITGWVGTPAANQAMREADVLLAFGTRFSETDTSGWTPGKPFSIPPSRLIHVDIDPSEIARVYPTEIGVVGDAKAVAAELAEALRTSGAGGRETAAWRESILDIRRSWKAEVDELASSNSTPIAPARFTRDLRAAMAEDAVMMTDVGNSQKWIVQQFEIKQPGTLVTSLGGAAMGFGPCGVLGAQLAMPDRQVVCVTGDGSMSMSLHVLPTAVEYELPVVYVVANDYAYASVMRPQQMRFGKDRYGHFTLFEDRSGNPYRLDFAAVAKAVGMEAERVIRPDDLRPALERAFSARRPYLLDVEIERDTYVPLSGGGTFVLPPKE